ncbi:hypothetical protein LCGC14_1040470, partial [marine sediment metagenome]
MNNNQQIDWYADKKEEAGKYPIIWNTSKCEVGECKNDRTVHRWSLPFTTSFGLTKECFDCNKTRQVEGLNPHIWVSKQSYYSKQRIEEM